MYAPETFDSSISKLHQQKTENMQGQSQKLGKTRVSFITNNSMYKQKLDQNHLLLARTRHSIISKRYRISDFSPTRTATKVNSKREMNNQTQQSINRNLCFSPQDHCRKKHSISQSRQASPRASMSLNLSFMRSAEKT